MNAPLTASPALASPRRSAPLVRHGDESAERDADRVAARALAQPGAGACACGGGCPRCRPASAGAAAGGAVGDAPDAVAPALRGAGEPLRSSERGFMESRLGADFGGVRVHDDAASRDAAAAVGAEAFAFREHVVFGAGKRGDTRLLAHELAHVVQQRESGVRLQRSVVEASPSSSGISGTWPPAPAPAGKASTPAAPGVDPKFWEWWKRVIGFEGTLSAWKANPANKNDKGGETNFGITKQFYLGKAKALGLDPTDAGFQALTPDQAMRFGMLSWKSSGASRINNTGVAIVIADWFWGGINLQRLTAILKSKGFDATYDLGSPSKATTDFMNTLDPDELLDLMSDSKAEQYKSIAKEDPSQQQFLGGWLKRNEERRAQGRAFTQKPPPAAVVPEQSQMSLWDRAQLAMRHARMADGADARAKAATEIDAAIAAIDAREKAGFAHAEEAVSMRALRDELRQTRKTVSDG